MIKNKTFRRIILIGLTIVFLGLLFVTVKEVLAKKNEEPVTKSKISTEQKQVEEIEVEEVEEKIVNSEPFILALFGIDTRGEESSRTDTIMLVRYDREFQKADIVSIPRDSYVKIKGYGYDKINAAHAYGDLDLAIETIEALMDIKIDYYARADFQAFAKITEIIGGVEVTVEKNMTGNGINIKKGTQVLEGQQLLDYVRFRKDAEGDFGRINRQQEVMIKLTDKMLSLETLPKIPKIISTINENVDTNIEFKEFLSLAGDLKSVKDIDIEQHRLQTVSDFRNKIWYEMIVEEDLELKSSILKGINLEEVTEEDEYEFNSTNSEALSQSRLIKRMVENGDFIYIKETDQTIGLQEGFQTKTTSDNWGF